MKKILCVLLTLAMIFGLAGCGDKTAAGVKVNCGVTHHRPTTPRIAH